MVEGLQSSIPPLVRIISVVATVTIYPTKVGTNHALQGAGGCFYPVKLDGQIEKLCNQIKRWTYRGRPTKKARKLQAIEAQLSTYGTIDWDTLL